MEPIEKWREEFESILKNIDPSENMDREDKSDPENGCNDFYEENHVQNMWNGFVMAKRSQPVVELPAMFTDYYLGRPSYDAENIHDSLTATGIQYRIKGE